MTVVKAACQDFKTIPEMCVVDASTKGSGLPLAGFKDYIGDESRVDIVLSLTAEVRALKQSVISIAGKARLEDLNSSPTATLAAVGTASFRTKIQ